MLDYRAFRILTSASMGARVDRQPYRDSISADLSGMFGTGSTQGTITTGSFAFTESEIRQVINNWLALEDSYNKSIETASDVLGIPGPGLDYASGSFADAANQSGKSLLDYLEKNRAYCAEQADLSQKALDDYLGIEHTNATDFKRTDPQSPPPVF